MGWEITVFSLDDGRKQLVSMSIIDDDLLMAVKTYGDLCVTFAMKPGTYEVNFVEKGEGGVMKIV